jgi:hypothetical protein
VLAAANAVGSSAAGSASPPDPPEGADSRRDGAHPLFGRPAEAILDIGSGVEISGNSEHLAGFARFSAQP